MNNILELDENLLKDTYDNKDILITGGTGTFGNQITEILLSKFNPKRVIIFSRDEFKQDNMRKKFNNHSKLRFFLGDIRDYERLTFAFKEIDIIFHAAALKQVPAIEYNPMEAIKTNIYGSENVIKAAIECNVPKVLAISTDKSVNPSNLYGATKMCLEKLFVSYNLSKTKFSVLRYGNVMGSRGSVIPLFKEQKKTGTITITDPKMTRFTMTIDQAINFSLNCGYLMIGGEIFVSKIPSYSINQLKNIIAPDCETKIIGLRPGEKIYETLVSKDEINNCINQNNNYYVITPFIKNISIDYNKIYGDNYIKKEYNSKDNELILDNILLNQI